MNKPDAIGKAMQAAVDAGVFPGAVLYVRLRGEVMVHRAVGDAARLPKRRPANPDTIYDLASLTKPLATATALLHLLQDGRLRLETSLQELLRDFKGAPAGAATVFHLLNHSAGLPAWCPFYEIIAEKDRTSPGLLRRARAAQMMRELIRQEPLVSPLGARSVYSDLGFMLLGWIVEERSGESLQEYCRKLYARLGASPLGYPPVEGMNASLVAATEEDSWRGRILCGEVHDENASAMGGAAGHAGLFGTAAAVAAVTGSWLAGYHGRPSPFRQDLVRRFVARQARTPGSSWGLGWDTPSPPSSSGRYFSDQAFGHLGFTGTSIWVDPVPELEVILLSNRVHPTRQNNLIRDFRPKIHDLIYETSVGAK